MRTFLSLRRYICKIHCFSLDSISLVSSYYPEGTRHKNEKDTHSTEESYSLRSTSSHIAPYRRRRRIHIQSTKTKNSHCVFHFAHCCWTCEINGPVQWLWLGFIFCRFIVIPALLSQRTCSLLLYIKLCLVVLFELVLFPFIYTPSLQMFFTNI